MKIRAGDNVVVITGKDKGKTGSVLRVLPNKGRLVVAGINMRTRHMPKTPQRAGQKIQYEASVSSSNVMVIDPKTKKRARIGYQVDSKGSKKRIARQSGEVITASAKPAADTPTKKATKDTKSAKDEMKEEREAKKEQREGGADKSAQSTKAAKKDQPDTSEKPTSKKPFWKKMGFGADAAEEAEVDEPSHMNQDHSVPDSTASSRRSGTRGS